jgi:outer membrane protein TolC
MLRYLLPSNGLAPVAFLALLIQSPDPAHAAGVVTSLREAESFAIERDAGLAQIAATREALEERIVASGQLPDPRLRFGALNLPVDSFELDQEPMTQLLVGLSQSFPPGRTLALRSASQASQAAAQAEILAERRRMIRRQVRLLWTDIAQLQDAARIVERKQQWYRELEDAVTASYSSGARGQHDVVRARLERRWTGAAPVDGMDIRIPVLPAPEDYETALQSIERHPLLRASASAVEVRELGEELVREQYKPSFGVDVAYGFRSGEDASGDERPDFFSAMLNFSLPVLSGRRQDRELAAAQAERRAAREAETDRRRELVAQLDSLWAGLTELEARDSLFQSDVLPDANTNVEATRAAYQNDYASFAELVGAQTLLLTQELSYLSLRADLARNRARLLYLTEEESQ